MSQPVVFAAPADIELRPNPVNPDWIIEGKPQARAKRLAEKRRRHVVGDGVVVHARPVRMALRRR